MADNKLIYYDNDTGLYKADKSTIKESLKNVVKEAYGEVLLDDNYPDGILINGLTEMINSAFETIESTYNMLDINSAEGVVLDTIGNIRNEHRKDATASILKIRMSVNLSEGYSSDLNVSITSNSLSLKDENNNYWYVYGAYTLTIPAGTTSADIDIQFTSAPAVGVMQEPTSLSIGYISGSFPIAQENLIFTITGFTSGENVETDIVFRNRMNSYSVFNSVTIKENLSSELSDLSYIKDVKIYYNNSTLYLYTKGADPTDPSEVRKIPSGRMYVLIKPTVDFSTDFDKRQEVFGIIEDYKGLGTLCWLPNPTTGLGTGYSSTSGSPLVVDGISQFLVPSNLTIPKIKISYIKTNSFNNDPSDISDPTSDPVSVVNVKNLIKLYVDSLGIGKDLTVGNLINYLYSSTDEIRTASVLIYSNVNNNTTVGTFVNNDMLLVIALNNIELEEQE